jgi:hypothetical protein
MNDGYVVVFCHLLSYVIASGDTPDMHESRHRTKLKAWLVARQYQIDKGRDPNFVIDLTNVPETELGPFLR